MVLRFVAGKYPTRVDMLNPGRVLFLLPARNTNREDQMNTATAASLTRGSTIVIGGGRAWEVMSAASDGTLRLLSLGGGSTGRRVKKTLAPGTDAYAKARVLRVA